MKTLASVHIFHEKKKKKKKSRIILRFVIYYIYCMYTERKKNFNNLRFAAAFARAFHKSFDLIVDAIKMMIFFVDFNFWLFYPNALTHFSKRFFVKLR